MTKIARIPLIVVAAAVCIVPATAVSSASGASRADLNRCSDIGPELRGGSMLYKATDEVDSNNPKSASGHLEQVEERMARARKILSRARPGEKSDPAEMDRNDPALKECIALLDERQAYIDSLKAKIAVAEKRYAMKQAFWEKTKDYEDSFKLLAQLFHTGNKGKDVFGSKKPKEARKVLDDLEEIEKVCTADSVDAKFTPTKTFEKEPENWCYVAKGRQKMIAVATKNKHWHVEGYGNFSIVIPDSIKSLSKESSEGYLDPWVAELVADSSDHKAQFTKLVDAWWEALGFKLDGDLYEAIEKNLVELREKVDALAPNLAFPKSGPHATTLEGYGRRDLKKNFPTATVLNSVMDADGFTITKNKFGIPTDRYRSGQLLYKLPVDKQWCRQRSFSYVEQYAGGGRYQAASGVSFQGAVRFVNCK